MVFVSGSQMKEEDGNLVVPDIQLTRHCFLVFHVFLSANGFFHSIS
jgi:hypothetical protein